MYEHLQDRIRDACEKHDRDAAEKHHKQENFRSDEKNIYIYQDFEI